MTTRTCFWPECKEPAPCACLEHWSKLPTDIKNDLTRAFDGMRGSETITPGFANAIARARAWVVRTFSGEEERRDPGKWERLRRFVRGRDEARARRREAPADVQPAPEASIEPRQPEEPRKPWRHLRLVD